jgi:hypothetical protein
MFHGFDTFFLKNTDAIPWVHHSREEESLDYDGGFVRLQIHMNFDTIIYRQQSFFAAAFQFM